MHITLQVVVQDEGETPATVTEIAQFERTAFDAGSLGLHLAEAKALLGKLQRTMVSAQVAEMVAQSSVCPKCGAPMTCKGHHRLVFRSPFGRLSFDSPRLYPCRQCSGSASTFSPLASCLPERVSPELQYLEVKFAALMSYGLTVNVLQEILPLDHALAASSIRRQVRRSVAGWKRTRRPMTGSRGRWPRAPVCKLSRSPVRSAPSALTAATFGWPATGDGRTAGLK